MRTTEILTELVRFDTVSARSNLELMAWIKVYLAERDVPFWTVTNADGRKENLVATVGPALAGGIVLSGHTDVVPVDGQAWDSDPFELGERDGRFYGRGACDMKGFIASALAAVPRMQDAGLPRPIHLAFTYDEEIGCLGAPDMIQEMSRELPPVEAVIVGEPTEMKIVAQHKGSFGATARFKGKSAHSSKPALGVNAIEYAAKFIQELASYFDQLKCAPRQIDGLDPGYTTVNLGSISGGTATNIIAEECHVDLSVRFMPDELSASHFQAIKATTDGLQREMRQSSSACHIDLAKVHEIPPLRADENSKAIALCTALTGQNTTTGVSFGTEAGQFQEAGYSTVILGPGSIEQAHMPNEFIEVDQLRQCDAFIDRLIETMRG